MDYPASRSGIKNINKNRKRIPAIPKKRGKTVRDT